MKNWILETEEEIDIAHFLEDYEGKCSQLHGHRYKIEVKYKIFELKENGLSIDFNDIKSIVNQYDHKCLNDFFKYTTAENFSNELYVQLENLCFYKEKRIADLEYVKVFETPNNRLTYYED